MSAQGTPVPATLTVVKAIDVLAPKFRDGVQAALIECRSKGLDAVVYESFRSPELAQLYYARGRTIIPPTYTVTNAPDNTFSWHGYKLAVDVISRSKAWDASHDWFREVADIFKRHDCKWGGDWKRADLPHFQWHRCKASPSSEARRLLAQGGIEAVWHAVRAA